MKKEKTRMVRHFKIQCPRCGDTCELYLSNNAPIVILNCPNCWTPMLHNGNGVYLLSQHQMAQLVQSREHSLLNLLERTAGRDHGDAGRVLADIESFLESTYPTLGTSNSVPDYDMRNPITCDDIIDLRIELETCKDSQEFINKL